MGQLLPENSTLARRLRRAAAGGALPHAIIFSGSGDRMAAARFAAAAMECEAQSGKPCLQCRQCRKVLEDIHPDVQTVQDPDHRELPVDLLRSLRQDAYIRPNDGAAKVYIFPDCDALNQRDQNVLLKLVEEGPGYAAFLFCAENPGVLLPTVRSRCAELSVRPTEQEAAAPSPEAQALLEAMAGGESPAVTQVLVGFENGKMTREKLQQVLRECREGSLQALRLRWGAPPETLCADGVGPLSRRLTKKQLMRLCEMLGKFAQECEWNVAVGQVLGAVAAEWEDIL